METGSLDDGLNALTEALAAADKNEIRHYEAETHRLKVMEGLFSTVSLGSARCASTSTEAKALELSAGDRIATDRYRYRRR